MLIDPKRILRRKAFFTLAQILAILSGMWMVAAGIGISLYNSGTLFIQNQLGLAFNAELANNTNVSAAFFEAVDPAVNLLGTSIDYFKFSSHFAIGFAFAALLVWLFGSCLKDDK